MIPEVVSLRGVDDYKCILLRGSRNAALLSMLLLVPQRWRRYDTRGSWRSAGLGMSREGSQLVGYRRSQ